MKRGCFMGYFMGAISSIAIIAISIVIGLIFTVIGIFVGHIILFDSILISIAAGILSNQILHIHPAFCLLISIALFVILFKIQYTKIGFWIISVILSAFWGFVFSICAYAATNADMIWTYVILGIGFIVMMLLHLKAKTKDN